MSTSRSPFFQFFLILVILAGLLGFARPAAPVQAATSSFFGYTWLENSTTPFVDISTTGSQISFPDQDDGLSLPLGLGFNFPYFENLYSSVIVNTNGLLMFGSEVTQLAVTNKPLPFDQTPNDLVAPFWDDLILGAQGRVLYQQFADSFIVQYDQVKRLGGSEPLTFEVIFHASGNFSFVYQELSGDLNQASIGFEDSDGVDGLELLYNGVGSLAGLNIAPFSPFAVDFTYPLGNPRFKMTPLYQSDFLVSGVALFPVTVKNTSTVPDTFNLDWEMLHYPQTGDPWMLRFLDANLSPLIDTDWDTSLDTGSLLPNASKLLYVEISSPLSPAPVGEYVLGNLITTSRNSVLIDQDKSTSVTIQAANPAPFVQAFSSSQNEPAYFQAIHPRQLPDYPGLDFIRPAMLRYDYSHSLAIVHTQNQRYLAAWEDFQHIYANVQYSLAPMAVVGQPQFRILKDNNTGSPDQTFDRSPAVAYSSGISGIAFIEDVAHLEGTTLTKKSNIMLALIGDTGEVLEIINLTNNPSFGSDQQLNIPFFTSPRIATASDGRFLVTWEQRIKTDEGTLLDIQVAGVDPDGTISSIPCTFTAASTNQTFIGPSLLGLQASLSSGLLTYFQVVNNSDVSLWLSPLSGINLCASSRQDLGLINGRSLDMVQVNPSTALLGWTEQVSGAIQYMLFNFETKSLPAPVFLEKPDGRTMASLSMTRTPGDFFVLTWENADRDRLYYTLLDANGEMITPPMIFHQTTDLNPGLQTGAPGASLAPLDSPLIFFGHLPVISR